MAVEATRRWADAGIFANALNPGAIATNLQKHAGGKLVTPRERQKTTQQGAATSVLLATSRQLERIGVRYFEDCSEASVVDRRPDNFGGGVAPYARSGKCRATLEPRNDNAAAIMVGTNLKIAELVCLRIPPGIRR
jgi:NAD(P)-dependent dehydrogenase (short-subunit alcohol dehydrogenase family)